MEKVLVEKKLLEEVMGALAALSMTNGGLKYLDDMIEKIEESIKENE